MIDVHFDFETYSAFDLKKGGVWGYSEHESTEVICMAYAYGNGKPKLWLPGDKLPDFLADRSHETYRLHAHNSFFEYCIIRNTMKLPTAPFSQWVDTAAMAAALALPRALFALCPVLGVHTRDEKDKYGGFLIRKLCMPQKYTAKEMTEMNAQWEEERERLAPYEPPPPSNTYRSHDPELLARMYEYCLQDVIAERACEDLMLPMGDKEHKVWQADQTINARGVNVDVPLVEDCIAIYEKQVVTLTDKLKTLTGLENPNSQQQFLGWATGNGYTEDNLQADTLRDFLEGEKLDSVLTDAIKMKTSLARTAPKKFYGLLKRMSKNGRNMSNFMYHGASTGRWASTGINLQNLLRPKMGDVDSIIEMLPDRDPEALELLWGDSIEAIASCIRGMLIASDGCRLIICDYAQVEARIIAWLAGELATLDIFRQGKDIYVHAASGIFRTVAEEVTKDQRFAGKTATLACGFQGGWAALQKMAKAYGVELEDKFCNEIVQKWRLANPRIVNYWSALEMTAIAAIQNPNKSFNVKELLAEGPTSHMPDVKYKFSRGYLFCQLPSGRLLAYASPSLEKKTVRYYKISDGEFERSMVFNDKVYTPAQFEAMADDVDAEIKEFDTFSIRFFGVDPKTKRWTRQHTYGGSLAENVTQAVARDLLAEAMVKSEEKGYPIVLHVHDELVADVPRGEGSLEGLRSIMLDSPEWAEGLPLDAEGCESERFKK